VALFSFQRRYVMSSTLGVLPMIALLIAPAVASGQAEGWRWFAGCSSSTTMTLTVQLDTAVLHTSSFPICRMASGASSPLREITFTISPWRAITWTGYRSDSGEVTLAGRPLEVRIWQAGADAIGPILGVVILGRDSVFMNTVHIATVDRAATTELADGLIVTTSPKKSP